MWYLVSSSSNYVLEILGRLWYHEVLNIFVTFGKFKFVIFFSGKKREIYIPSISGYQMPLVLSFANLNPCVDLKANVFRERNTNVIRSLQDFTAIPRKDFMKNFKFSTTHEEDLKLYNVSCRIWTVAILSRKLCVEIVLKSSNSLKNITARSLSSCNTQNWL